MPRFANPSSDRWSSRSSSASSSACSRPTPRVKLKPLGDGFIKLIKMIIPVLVFCVVVHGIAGAGDLQAGRPRRRQVADLLRGA